MPKGANGLRPGPSARRFLWSIGDEEVEEEDGRRRTIVCRIWVGFFGGRRMRSEEGVDGVGDHVFRPEINQKSQISIDRRWGRRRTATRRGLG